MYGRARLCNLQEKVRLHGNRRAGSLLRGSAWAAAGAGGVGSGGSCSPGSSGGCLMAIARNQGRAVEGRQRSCEFPLS